jgi:hypothetical protein
VVAALFRGRFLDQQRRSGKAIGPRLLENCIVRVHLRATVES